MKLWLDIEAIPTQNPKLVEYVAASVTHPASMKKAETIAKWDAEEKPAAVEEVVRKTALDPFFGEVICVAIAINDSDPVAVWREPHEPEANLLRQLSEEINEQIKAHSASGHREPTICGYNVLDYDLRFLAVRYAIHRTIMPPHKLMRLMWLNSIKPWSDDVLDVMTYAAGPRGRIAMDRLCHALGMDGKGDITGATVWDAVRDGRLLDVVDYCRADVVRTRELYRALGGV